MGSVTPHQKRSNMHYATAKANDKAHREMRKGLRNNATPAEVTLWKALRGRGLGGYKFRRQQGIGEYVLDFYCPELKLCVEVDGSSHDNKYFYDEQRTVYLNKQGIRVVRYTNEQVLTSLNGVAMDIAKIAQAIKNEQCINDEKIQTPPPTPPLGREGSGFT